MLWKDFRSVFPQCPNPCCPFLASATTLYLVGARHWWCICGLLCRHGCFCICAYRRWASAVSAGVACRGKCGCGCGGICQHHHCRNTSSPSDAVKYSLLLGRSKRDWVSSMAQKFSSLDWWAWHLFAYVSHWWGWCCDCVTCKYIAGWAATRLCRWRGISAVTLVWGGELSPFWLATCLVGRERRIWAGALCSLVVHGCC